MFRPVILITGFASAPGAPANPSGGLLSLIAAHPPTRAEIRTQLLPHDPDGALLKAVEAMDRLFPDAVIALGIGEGTDALSVERVAINLDETLGSSRSKRPEPIDAAGPAAYFATLPVHMMVERMLAGGAPATVSNSAGTLINNRLFYALLHYVAVRGQETWFKRRPPAGLSSRVGFIRIPAPPAPASRARSARGSRAESGARGLSLDSALAGVTLAIEAVIDELASHGARAPELTPK